MKKILLTGFEPFDCDLFNPSKDLLAYMQLKKSKNNYEFLCLPVSFKSSYPKLKEKIIDFSPDLIVLTGLAKDRKKISIEKIGINWINARIPDNDGQAPAVQKIMTDGPDGLFCKLNLEKFIEQSKDNNIEISFTAGTYVCNYVYYKTLIETSAPAVFIHLPGSEDYFEIFNSIFNFLEINL